MHSVCILLCILPRNTAILAETKQRGGNIYLFIIYFFFFFFQLFHYFICLQAAENSLIFYRNYGKPSKGSEYLKKEIHKLRSVSSTDENRLTFTDFTTPFAKKALVIGVSLVALNQFCGCFTMLSYTAKIFEESGSNLAPNTSAIIVAVIQLCGTYISTILVDRSGRKLLLSVSAVGIGLGLTCLGSYILFKTQGYNLDSLSWIPIACFSFIIFIGAVGVLTLPFLVIAEIMPEKVKLLLLIFTNYNEIEFGFYIVFRFGALVHLLR